MHATARLSERLVKKLFRAIAEFFVAFESLHRTGHHGNAVFRDHVSSGTVQIRVVADPRSFRDRHITIDDRAANMAGTANHNVPEQDAGVYFGVAIDAAIRRQHTVGYASAADDAS